MALNGLGIGIRYRNKLYLQGKNIKTQKIFWEPSKRPKPMPTRPPVYRGVTRKAQKREADIARAISKPWRTWYSRKEWLNTRRAQLQRQPLCERHLKAGEIVAATVVHHVIPHRGDWERFIGGPFESLCKPCHDSDAQSEEREAAG